MSASSVEHGLVGFLLDITVIVIVIDEEDVWEEPCTCCRVLSRVHFGWLEVLSRGEANRSKYTEKRGMYADPMSTDGGLYGSNVLSPIFIRGNSVSSKGNS